jgi:RimJ/RimL family protein N-acetyltransferase
MAATDTPCPWPFSFLRRSWANPWPFSYPPHLSPHLRKRAAEGLREEKHAENEGNHAFTIRTLDGDRIIGGIGLDGIRWMHRDCFVGIGLGDREFWGKGYGTDAMKIILRYAFSELNLQRVTLDVFEYNQRGVRSYEKAGFVIEGRQRGQILREGRRWDVIFMGILREDWQKLEQKKRKKKEAQ